jgi:hypothetical protein
MGQAEHIDDAQHIVLPIDRTRTLCGQKTELRNFVTLTGDIMVDDNMVCWTCADEAQRLLKAIAKEGGSNGRQA